MLGVTLLTWLCFLAARIRRRLAAGHTAGQYAIELLLVQLGVLPFVAAGASLLAHSGGGLYWAVGGLVFAFGGAAATSWVLLIEIFR